MSGSYSVEIRQAQVADIATVGSILVEAATWLQRSGRPLWRTGDVEGGAIAADVKAGMFWIARVNGEAAGTVRFQLEDKIMWPDAMAGEAAYLHRLAVRRRFAGGTVSGALLRWGADRARSIDRTYLRLDCEAARPSLRSLYERCGFQFHSEKQVGPYRIARYQQKLEKAAYAVDLAGDST